MPVPLWSINYAIYIQMRMKNMKYENIKKGLHARSTPARPIKGFTGRPTVPRQQAGNRWWAGVQAITQRFAKCG